MQVEAIDNVCNGLDFCIVNREKKTESIKELEDMVRRHGGKVVTYANQYTFVIIVGRPETKQAQDYIKKAQNNIAKPEWLIRALGSDKPLKNLIKFTPNDMVYALPSLQQEFDADLDAGVETDSEPLIQHDNSEQPIEIVENVGISNCYFFANQKLL